MKKFIQAHFFLNFLIKFLLEHIDIFELDNDKYINNGAEHTAHDGGFFLNYKDLKVKFM